MIRIGWKIANPLWARRLMAVLADEVDEERAVFLRHEYGQRRWLVSWQRRCRGVWVARVSGPGNHETVEQEARTRVEAIDRAARIYWESTGAAAGRPA